jgi:IS30 family transposase
MVSIFKGKNHLTIDDRKKIQEGIALGLTYREIGETINRAKSVIIREAKRLGDFQDYEAEKAQSNFESKQKLSGIIRGSPLYLRIKEEENLE